MQSLKAFCSSPSFRSAELVLIPVPWAVTSSYRAGSDQGPELIRKASDQLDFFNPLFQCSYNDKICFLKEEDFVRSMNKEAQSWVKSARKQTLPHESLKFSQKVNEAGFKLNRWVYEKALEVFNQGKIPALIGGDHSVSEGFLSLIGEKRKGDYSLLHLDAHADLRSSYESFQFSHASVMHNVLNLKHPPKKLVQVGVRDFCEEEHDKIQKEKKIVCYLDEWIYTKMFQGETWASLCHKIVSELSRQVYVSLDVDALSWSYAPGTGTPVPGGLSFNQVLYLLAEIKKQKKQLIAFDVVETSPGEKESDYSEWNGNVSARLIYYLSGLALNSYSKI